MQAAAAAPIPWLVPPPPLPQLLDTSSALCNCAESSQNCFPYQHGLPNWLHSGPAIRRLGRPPGWPRLAAAGGSNAAPAGSSGGPSGSPGSPARPAPAVHPALGQGDVHRVRGPGRGCSQMVMACCSGHAPVWARDVLRGMHCWHTPRPQPHPSRSPLLAGIAAACCWPSVSSCCHRSPWCSSCRLQRVPQVRRLWASGQLPHRARPGCAAMHAACMLHIWLHPLPTALPCIVEKLFQTSLPRLPQG